jgi:hypothetical protein
MEQLKKLIDDAEMLADVKAYDEAMARIASGEEELIPFEITKRRLAGESTVKIWREYRGLTQEGLANVSKVSRATLKKLAGALKVGLDELV